MLSNHEFDQWVHRCNLTDEARGVIENIRSSPPARRVQSRMQNVRGHFNRSRKMAHTIQYESRTVELPAILLMELDADVLEIWDQPPSFTINYKDDAGRNRGHIYTADFFVLRQHGAGWEEWKTEEQLTRLAAKNSEKYCLGEDHRWCFPPGERHAATFGLYFHVHSSAELNSEQLQNLKLLLPYFAGLERGHDNRPARDTILSIVAAEPGITMAELLSRTADAHSHDVFRLIISRQVYVDLRCAWLGNEQQVHIYRTKEAADFSALLGEMRNQTEVIRPSIGVNKQQDSNISHGLETEEEMAEAMRRWEIIKSALRGEPITDCSVATRTHRRWIASFKRAAASSGNGLLGLIPRHRHKGNATDRLAVIDERIRPLMIECIKEVYETPVKKTKSLVYGELVRRCERIGLRPPTYKTFNQAIKHRTDAAQIAKIDGRKVSYQHAEFMDSNHLELPAHGSHPWELAHIDHTELDVELRHSTKHTLMGKAWLTLTLPSTRKGTAKVLRSRGIQINQVFYRSPRLRRPELYGQQVEVRYDPFNMAHVYALIGKEWIVCHAPPAIYGRLKDCTEREMKIFSEEQRQLTRTHGRGFRLRARSLAESHALREESERIQQQRLRDAEVKMIGERRGRTLDVKEVEPGPYPDDMSENSELIDPVTGPVDLSCLVSFQRAKRRMP